VLVKRALFLLNVGIITAENSDLLPETSKFKIFRLKIFEEELEIFHSDACIIYAAPPKKNRKASVIVKQSADKTRLYLLTHLTISVNQRFPTITIPQTAFNQTPELT
jgi:hypothetical protein